MEDENLGIKKLVLTKNSFSPTSEFVIEKIIFKIFRDTAQFLSQKDSINVFNDKESLIGDTLPRLSVYEYTLPQYVSLFLNTNTIKDTALRSLIIESIQRENILHLLWEKNFLAVTNPYLLTGSIENQSKEKNSESILKRNGYFRKEELLKLSSTRKNDTSTIPQVSSTWSQKIDEWKKTKIITSPSNLYYNFIIKDDFLLQGNVKDDIEAVYVNNYQLKGYKIWDKKFTYRLKQDTLETIKEGKNLYEIYFEKNGKKLKVDEVLFYYYKDEKVLNSEKEKLFSSSPLVLTGGLVTQFSSKIDDSLSQEIEKLDAKYVYDKDFKVLKYVLWYPNNDLHLETTAKSIQAQLSDIGILIDIKWLDISQINQSLLSWKKEYDMILIWLNLGYFENNIFPYFHSSQVEKGYNFSNYKKLGLDIILEDLKTLSLSPDKSRELQLKALEMISQESVVKTLYTPIIKQLVDKNIKNYTLPSFLHDEMLRFYWFKSAYTVEKKMIQVWEKSFFWFFYFLWENLLR